MIRTVACTLLASLLAFPAAVFADTTPLIESFLKTGEFDSGEEILSARLDRLPDDDQTRFGLATIQLMGGLETLMQSLYRYGLRDDTFASFLPILRLPVPSNPDPEVLTYAASRQVLQTWLDDLETVRQTLAPIEADQVKLPLRLGLIRLDINADGTATEAESFANVFAAVTGTEIPAAAAENFVITFDRGDVLWLRAYTHLLSAMVEFILAHDTQLLFEAGAHLFFQKIETPHAFLLEGKGIVDDFGGFEFVDYIAILHLMRFEPIEPERLERAHQHLLETVKLSRQSWQLISAETDDDHEWLPNPDQTGVIPDAEITQEMIDTWLLFLSEAEIILKGEKLIPFWRSDDRRGINLKRVFLEPSTFDPVLWVQGTAATPYLERGKLTDADVWQQLSQVFGWQFVGFAIWFN
jgi:hypothetical protein